MIEVYLDDLLLGTARTNCKRADVFRQYPEYDNPNSGWIFEQERAELPASCQVRIKVYLNGECFQEYCREPTIVEPAAVVEESVSDEILQEREFLAMRGNLYNKLLFDLDDLNEADHGQLRKQDDSFSVAVAIGHRKFIESLAEEFDIPLSLLERVLENERNSWVRATREHLTPGRIISLRERILSRLTIWQKNKIAFERVLEEFPVKRGRYLDVGCQFGLYLVCAAQSGFRDVCGVEINPNLVPFADQLKAWVEEEWKVRFTYLVGDFGEVALDEAAYDVITCIDVLEHTPDLGATIENLKRFCAPDGLVYIYQGNALSLMMATREPHYSLPGLTIFSRDLAVDILNHLGKVNERAAYVVSRWPTYDEIHRFAEDERFICRPIGGEVNIRNDSRLPEAEETDKCILSFQDTLKKKLHPLLTPELSDRARQEVEGYLGRLKEDRRTMSEWDFRFKYLMQSWNIVIEPRT